MKNWLFGIFQVVLFSQQLFATPVVAASKVDTNEVHLDAPISNRIVSIFRDFIEKPQIGTKSEHPTSSDSPFFEELQEDEEEASSHKKLIERQFFDDSQYFFSFQPNRYQAHQKFVIASHVQHSSVTVSRTILFQVFRI